MNKQRKLSRITILLITLFSIAFLAYLMIVQAGLEESVQFPLNSSYGETGSYEIDPATILADLDQGKTRVFKPTSVPSTTEENIPYTPYPTGSYHWSQSEYLKVASALHQFVWQENLDNWRIYSMYFYLGCQDNPSGFDSGKITYFKSIYGSLSYTTRVLSIYPVNNGASWGGKANFPRPIPGWQSIDTREVQVTAEDALKIAEEHGGKAFRLGLENACSIDVFTNPNPDRDNDWIVYYDNQGLSTFELHIDPYTGEYKIQQ